MRLNKKDFSLVMVIGAAVGILAQPIIGNIITSPSFSARAGYFLFFFLLAPSALFIASLFGRIWKPVYQFAKFAAVGSLNFFVDVGVLNIAIFLTGVASGPLFPVFKTISFFAATTNSFFWNRNWTFYAGRIITAKETALFYAVALVGGLINIGTASYIVNGIMKPERISANLWANIGALVGIFAGMVFDFVGYKYVVYQEHRRQNI